MSFSLCWYPVDRSVPSLCRVENIPQVPTPVVCLTSDPCLLCMSSYFFRGPTQPHGLFMQPFFSSNKSKTPFLWSYRRSLLFQEMPLNSPFLVWIKQNMLDALLSSSSGYGTSSRGPRASSSLSASSTFFFLSRSTYLQGITVPVGCDLLHIFQQFVLIIELCVWFGLSFKPHISSKVRM